MPKLTDEDLLVEEILKGSGGYLADILKETKSDDFNFDFELETSNK